MKLTRLHLLAAMLTFGVAGCAVAQTKGPQPMLIDKIPTNYWDSQVLLKPNQYPEQHTMVQQIGVLLHDKYQVTVQRFYELAPKDGMVVHHTATRSDLQNTMGTDLHLHQVFENSTAELPPTPYLGVWKSDGPHPEYVAVGMLYLSPPNNHSTLLGYFELAGC